MEINFIFTFSFYFIEKKMMEFCNNIKTKYMTYLVEGLIRLINVENPLSVKKDPLKTIEKKY